MTRIPRSSGILLHPTSLPGPYGIGDLGASARTFIERLAAGKQRWWQMLPINAPGHGGSPYSAESAFAGNPALIDLDDLVARGLLTEAECQQLAARVSGMSTPRRINHNEAVPAKLELLKLASQRFFEQGGEGDEAFLQFCEWESAWLDDFALFTALKNEERGAGWRGWPEELVKRSPQAISAARARLDGALLEHSFYQYIFFSQWETIRAHARAHDVSLIGDIPIFVAMDSADVWTERHLFKLDALGAAEVVAGVPPDYFSETGQKWGNPVYDWEAVARDDYAWWIARVKKSVEVVDLVRIDHFRGFQDYWETPESEPTAMHGQWVPGPRHAFFDAIKEALGEVPFIAEDLGDVDDAVYALRDAYKLPGMKILQFAFGSGNPDHPFLPHTYPEVCVAYTGTHDNDTTRGWYEGLDEGTRHEVRSYLHCDDAHAVQALIERLFTSKAELAILPAQDLWELDSSHRMNTPATIDGNWSWRMSEQELDDVARWEALGALTERAQRG